MGRLLVTGAAGFIGSHLCERLLHAGHDVIGLDCFTDAYDPALKRRNVQPLLAKPRFRLIEEDLRRAPMEEILDGVDAVFHQAAQAGVRTSWGGRFRDYLSANVEATQSLLEACRGRGARLRRFVYASSSSVYGDAERFPTAEDDPKLPVSPYGVTKLAGELLVRLYAVQYGLPAVSLRYFTVYGPRQRPDMMFHRFFRAILRNEEIVVYGDGRQTRDFTYIDDAIEANLRALDTPTEPGLALNIGGGTRIGIEEALGVMERIAGRKAAIRHEDASPGDARHTAASTQAALRLLGLRPAVGLEDGLARMHAWMIRYLAGEPE